MDNRIEQQVNGVLDKYDKPYSSNGVAKNLHAWKNNKGWLVDLLRLHPNWNEDALAVVFEITHSREIDRSTVTVYKHDLCRLMSEMDISDEDQRVCKLSLDTVTQTYAKTLPSAETAAIIKDYSGVPCAPGQKNSRIINAICKRYGLDKHPNYNARFAKLADALNPLSIKRRALISVHPCDFLEMSNKNNDWSSCHRLDGGEYQGGTLSYMNDSHSMIFYTVDEGITERFYDAPKRTRQVFAFGNGVLLQSRLYPYPYDDTARDVYRNIVQKTISDCMDVPNLWALKKMHCEVSRHIKTHSDALHYRDYEYEGFHPNISLLTGIDNEGTQLLIGHTAYCLECEEPIDDAAHLYCDNCDDDYYVTCDDCGSRIPEDDAHRINGDWYCDNCSSYCEHCEEYVHDDTVEVRIGHHHSIYVCNYCLSNYENCEECGDYYHADEGQLLSDGFRCNDCLESLYCVCDDCGEFTHIRDISEIGDKRFCIACTDENQILSVTSDNIVTSNTSNISETLDSGVNDHQAIA